MYRITNAVVVIEDELDVCRKTTLQ